MRYELPDVTRRDTEVNEYYNPRTEEFEVVRQYGCYRVQETFLTPEGTILLLGYDPHGVQQFVVGVHNQSSGRYFADGNKARRYFAQRIAESFDLVVGPKRSVAVPDNARELLTVDAESTRKAAREYTRASVAQDEFEMEEAGKALEAGASRLAKQLQRTRIVTRLVYPTYEIED